MVSGFVQFYNSLKEAALVSLPGATRRLPSSFSDEIMKIEAANAAAAVEAEKAAVQAAAVQPEVMTTQALPVSAHSAAENSKSEVTAQHAQASAQPKKARAAAKRKASGVDRKHAAAGKAEAKDSQAEAQKAGSAGAERQEPVAGKVMASSKTPGAMPDAAAGSEPLGARIQAPEAVEKQLIVSMTDSATTCIDNAAAAAVNNQRAPASDSNMAARQNRPPLGTSAKGWAGIPLVSVGADDKLAAVLAGAHCCPRQPSCMQKGKLTHCLFAVASAAAAAAAAVTWNALHGALVVHILMIACRTFEQVHGLHLLRR